MGAKSAFESLKRLNAFSADPDELVIIYDRNHPRYDPGAHEPLDPAFVASIAQHGIGEPVVIRKDENGRPEVVDGRRRVRAAKLSNDGAMADKVMVPCVVRRGDAADAYTMTVALNVHRSFDSKKHAAMQAQRLSQLGRGEGDIAVALGVSVPTVKKLLAANTKTPQKERKKREKSKRRSLAEIKDRLLDPTLSEDSVLTLKWVLGIVSDITTPLERAAFRA